MYLCENQKSFHVYLHFRNSKNHLLTKIKCHEEIDFNGCKRDW